jgi:glycosyltransferase involved in cell wall biosynthesis
MKTKNNLKISVVMPSFNGVGYIERAIKSVMDQDYPNFDLFIKDGGSKDGSLEVIKYYAKKYPRKIKWISKKDKGQSDALNYGINKTDGDVIAWLNCDDVYKPGTFKKVAAYFSSHPDTMWLFGKCDIIVMIRKLEV